MSSLAVLGAGAGGTAATADLSRRGHDVRLWTRAESTLQPYRRAGGVRHEGVLGNSGIVAPSAMTTDLGEALDGADAVVVCLPANAHAGVARALADLRCSIPIVLNPGHTGGAIHVQQIFAASGASLPPLAELSTLSYVARKHAADTVTVTGVAESLWGACLPGGDEALGVAVALFPAVMRAADVLACDLANVNLVLHPPGAILAAAWIEATDGSFFFYTEGMTPSVVRVLRVLDEERLRVAAAFGHELPALHEEMAAIGTADRDAAARGDLRGAIATGEANRSIAAPESLSHRYYVEDFGYGLVPFEALAKIAGVEIPVARTLLTLGEALLGRDLRAEGLTADKMGIADLDRDRLLELVGRRVSG
ncbi:MAG: NAD/NADP octopine/nopaline dehydrogenase family protein [Microbacterium sp.]